MEEKPRIVFPQWLIFEWPQMTVAVTLCLGAFLIVSGALGSISWIVVALHALMFIAGWIARSILLYERMNTWYKNKSADKKDA